MAPIRTAIVNNNLILGTDKDLRAKFFKNLGWKQSQSSFGSTESFESFGSMGEDEAVIILNPCDYTVYETDRENHEEIDEEDSDPKIFKQGDTQTAEEQRQIEDIEKQV